MKKTLILFLFSFAAKAQFFQVGAQANFFTGHNIEFKNSTVLDSSVLYNEKLFVLDKKLNRLKGSNPVGFETYFNYRFNQNHYLGLNFRYSSNKTTAETNDQNAGYYPQIKVKAPSLGICYGYTYNRRFLNYFFEGGLSATRLKFDVDWTQTAGRMKYENYLNQNNTFLSAYGKVGIKMWFLTLSTRMDVHVGDINNKSGIKKITYRPTLNVGFDLRSAFIGKKRFKTKDDYTQLDDDVKFEEKMDFGRMELEYGLGATLVSFRLKGPTVISYASGGQPVQIKLKEKWNQTSLGLAGNFKYAPFKQKRFVLGVFFNMGQIDYKRKIGTYTTNTINYTKNSIDAKTADLIFGVKTIMLGFGAGYRIKVTPTSFIEASPLFNLVSVTEGNNMSSNIKNYFDWKSGFSKSYGINISYKKKHWCAALKFSQGISNIENNNRFKNGTYYSLLFFRDVNFTY